MWPHIRLLVAFSLVLALPAVAKDKKPTLPAAVVKARTVLVLIDPDAGINPADPRANRTAQEDVEKAFMKWGRLTPVMDNQPADIVIVVRKGSGKIVQPTIGGGPVNNRPVIGEATDNSIRIGGQHGTPPGANPQDTPDPQPHQQMEVGPSDDMFAVYIGNTDRPLDRSPVWRYVRKNALHSPDVPAVGEFRKLVDEAEKQQSTQKKP